MDNGKSDNYFRVAIATRQALAPRMAAIHMNFSRSDELHDYIRLVLLGIDLFHRDYNAKKITGHKIALFQGFELANKNVE